MTKSLCSLLLLLLCLSGSTGLAQDMTNEKMGKVLHELTDTISGSEGFWNLVINGMQLTVITDESHNRMRIITPIAYIEDIDGAMVKEALEANFHTALDIKYAISEEIMWSTFIHPLKELSEDQLQDAVAQVYFGALTFGSTYTSTNLSFPKNEAPRSE